MSNSLRKSKSSSPNTEQALSLYRQKRSPAETNEPFSAERKGSELEATHSGRFVVHLHSATRRHYDLRIESQGKLLSFAVPRGPSLDPNEKRLAVETEAHPLAYLDFENVIPEGNYGAGAMIQWDTGKITYLEGSVEQGLKNGKIDFVLAGFKLKGRFALVATGRRKNVKGQDNQWLLIKKSDVFVTQEDILIKEERSVLSGLTVDELAVLQNIHDELEAAARAVSSTPLPSTSRSWQPMYCNTAEVALADAELIYELKLDGVRVLAEKQDGVVTLRSRSGKNVSASYPELVLALLAHPGEAWILDGEIVAFDAKGKPSFQRLAQRIHVERPHDILRAKAEVPICYVVFDLLSMGGVDLCRTPLRARKALLPKVVRGRGVVRALDHLEGDGRALHAFCTENQLEGLVAKKKSSEYVTNGKRSGAWTKIKCAREADFVIIGFTRGNGARKNFGALCVGSYFEGELRYRGRVGSGFDDSTLRFMEGLLAQRVVPQFAGNTELPADAKGSVWVRPDLVANVRFIGFTEEGLLRFPIFSGLRDDVAPEACTAAPVEDLEQELELERPSDVLPASALPQVSRPDKIFFPTDGYTKLDLVRYYLNVAPWLLAFLRDRPIILVRYPDGILGKNFYQWNVPRGTPDWLRRLVLQDEDEPTEKKHVFLIDSQEALTHIINLGAIPIHILAFREATPKFCDFGTLDFDLGGQPFSSAVMMVLSMREILEDVGLTGFVKTSGQTGLHLLIPLGPSVPFAAAKFLMELLGRLLTAQHPEIATMERRVHKRGDRLYVDTGQTGEGRSIVAPYSVRAHTGAPVSTPLAWDEVGAGLDPRKFTIASVPERLVTHGDVWPGFFETTPAFAHALARLEKWVKR